MPFVDAGGQDTDNAAVHNHRWWAHESEAGTASLLAVQPWIQTTILNGRTVLRYLDLAALACEFTSGWSAEVAALSIMLHLVSPEACWRIIQAGMASIPAGVYTRAAFACLAAAARAQYDQTQRDATAIVRADMLDKVDVGAPLGRWQRQFTYEMLTQAECGAVGLGWLCERDDALRFSLDSALLNRLRQFAERKGVCPLRTGQLPYPAVNVPMPHDDVQPHAVAYAVADAMSQIYFLGAPAMRVAFADTVRRAAATNAELESIVSVVNGDTQELRRRVRQIANVVAPTLAGMLAGAAISLPETLEIIRRVAAALLRPAQCETAVLLTPAGLAARPAEARAATHEQRRS